MPVLPVAVLALAAAADPAGGDAFFTGKVLPILAKNCFGCHSHAAGKAKGGLALDSPGGWRVGGDTGPAVVPGKPTDSPLVRAVRYADPDRKMPPAGKLPDADVAALIEWVERGAPDPRTVPGPAAAPAGEWWSLKPLARPPVPAGAAHPVDAFVRAKLKEKGLSPAPEADPRTLIRRLTFDLHGLPPTPEEVDAFRRDTSTDAYAKLVDRLLASPRYGERWGRHWLDAARYADTHGTEHDLVRPNAWRYRDYVIARLNADVPYGRFVREQLAADVLFPDEPHLRPALGFVAAGPWDQSSASTAPKTFAYADRDDMVTAAMTVFAGTTAHCARCHDHKFDPIPQADYYALQAVFAGVARTDVPFDPDPVTHAARRKWQALATAAAARDRAVLLGPEGTAIATAATADTAVWSVLAAETFMAAGGADLRRLPDGSLLSSGPRPDVDAYTVTVPLPDRPVTAVRLEVLPDDSLPKRGPGRADNGNLHLAEIEFRHFAPAASAGVKVGVRRATADFEQEVANARVAGAVDGDPATMWGVYPRVGEPHEAVFELTTPVAGGRLIVVLRSNPGGGHGHGLGRFRLSATADPPATAAAVPADAREALRVPAGDRTEAQRLAVAAFAVRRHAEAELAKLPSQEKVYAAAGAAPKPVHVLKRGNVEKPGEEAAPGALSAVAGLPARFSAAADEGSRRAALAGWLTDPRNPLTWRVIVNRVWMHHFGRGLCDTPNDLGRMGGLPSHPELLDWLAADFRDGGQSLKALHRQIVTSATYRQASRHDPAAAKVDSESRFLWCFPRRRLDAESFRDAVLSVAGRLDSAAGGPPVAQYRQAKGNFTVPKLDYAAFDWDAPGAGRRSVYRLVYRTLPDPFMDALDFPDASLLSAGRGFSASPLQALALFNNGFVLRMSEHLAGRVGVDTADPSEAVRRAVRLALQREPTAAELDDLAGYAKKHGLPATCRLLLNGNEFLFVD